MQNLNPSPPRSACERGSQIIWIHRNFWDALIIATRGAEILFQVQMVLIHWFSSVQLLSPCLTLWDTMDCRTPGFPVLSYLLEFSQKHWVSDAIQQPHLLSSPSPLALYLSQHEGLFQWVSSSHQVAKVLELHFNIIPFYEYSGLISFRMDWFDLLAVQGTLKSLLQRHSSKASILQRSTFFMVHLSYPYVTTGRAIVLTRQTSAGKVMSLLLKVLSRFIVAFLPRILVGSYWTQVSLCAFQPQNALSFARSGTSWWRPLVPPRRGKWSWFSAVAGGGALVQPCRQAQTGRIYKMPALSTIVLRSQLNTYQAAAIILYV